MAESLAYHEYDLPVPLPGSGSVITSQFASHEYCQRLHSAYLKSRAGLLEANPQAESWESFIGGRRSAIMATLNAPQYKKMLRYALSNPLNTNLFYGFDNVALHFKDRAFGVDHRVYDVLLRFYEAAGGLMHQAEKGGIYPAPPVEELLGKIEERLGLSLIFPAPYKGMGGLLNKRGLVRNRALWELYLVWRAKELGATSILEIGGGLGYGAYYAQLLGIKKYAIIDIPLTLVASGHFLGLTLGEDKVRLYEEECGDETVRLLPPQALADAQKYDMVVNMDAFTEFGRETALDYVKKIKSISPRFLSINHEGNNYTTPELFREVIGVNASYRFPFWLRKGYVEEVFNLN